MFKGLLFHTTVTLHIQISVVMQMNLFSGKDIINISRIFDDIFLAIDIDTVCAGEGPCSYIFFLKGEAIPTSI